MDTNELVASNIRSYRKAQKITQEDLASKSGLSQVYLSHIETNKKNPTVKTISSIAEALDVAPSTLLTESDRENGVDFVRREMAQMLIRQMPLEALCTMASYVSLMHYRGAIDYTHEQAVPKQEFTRAFSKVESWIESLREVKGNGMLSGHTKQDEVAE